MQVKTIGDVQGDEKQTFVTIENPKYQHLIAEDAPTGMYVRVTEGSTFTTIGTLEGERLFVSRDWVSSDRKTVIKWLTEALRIAKETPTEKPLPTEIESKKVSV